jgi:Holliday junction resolvase
MSTASRGASREHAVKRLLEAEGWAVTRGAGSHGCADLWAARNRLLRLIQVKTDKAGPYAHFIPAERQKLASLAAQTGGVAELCWWPARKDPVWLLESDWPKVSIPQPEGVM